MPGPQQRQQVVDRGPDLAQIALHVRERGRPDRDHDFVRLSGVGCALGQLKAPARHRPVEQFLRARLGERHPPARTDSSRAASWSTPSTR